MQIRYKASDINNIIKEKVDKISNKKFINKSLTIDKAIAIIELKLKERVSNISNQEKNDLLFIEENGITIIIEIDLPITSKNEKTLKDMYEENGYYFSYHVNNNKDKYYLCIATR